ncbi:MAG: MerR family transcriptional regulator [Paracoccaceae bacterium]
MEKSPDAFRTISEVAEFLETPAHVLRFWESRFPQIRPVKRAGGRRYYRPADVALLTGIKHLLHEEGLTIRGVQKMLREQGVRHVASLSGQDMPDDSASAEAALEAALAANFAPPADEQLPQEAAESAQIVALESALKARQAQLGTAEAPPAPDPAPDAGTSADATDAIPPSKAPAPDEPARERRLSGPAPDADELPLFALHSAPPRATSQGATVTPAPEAPPQSLLARLRQLPKGSLATDEARALRDRLALLQARMAAAPAAAPGTSPL